MTGHDIVHVAVIVFYTLGSLIGLAMFLLLAAYVLSCGMELIKMEHAEYMKAMDLEDEQE